MSLRIYLTLISALCVTAISLQGQSSENYRFSILWNETQLNPAGSYFSFQGGEVNDISHFCDMMSVSSKEVNAGIASVRLIPVRTEKLKWDKADPPHGITSEYRFAFEIAEVRNQRFLNAYLIPLRVSGAGELERIVEFRLETESEDRPLLQARGPQNTDKSVLSDGDIYKIAVEKPGIHRIDRSFLESRLGINAGSVDPRNIKIYGHGGGMLPESNAAPRTDDLAELNIYIEGEQDGRFDAGDFILFYAEGPDKWSFDPTIGDYIYQKNIYDTRNYYFIKISPERGKRVSSAASISDTPEQEFTHYDFLQRYEVDRVNLLGAQSGTYGTGKDWYGDSFRTTRERTYTGEFDFTGTDLNADVVVRLAFAGRSGSGGTVQLTVGDRVLSRNFSAVNMTNIEATYASRINFQERIRLSTTNPAVQLRMTASGSDTDGWLDFIQIVNKRSLVLSNVQRTFRNASTLSVNTAGFILGNYNNQWVWDISNPLQPVAINIVNNTLRFRPEGKNREFIAFNPVNDMLTPIGLGKIANQNLHAVSDVDMLVVYHRNFKQAAERFVQHRSGQSGLKIAMAEITEVYNEFSSGKVDPTAMRDFVRMVYQRNADFRYLLLFGDGTYDYRGIMPNLSFENYIPVYQTDQSLNPISGFPSDDYFGLLGPTEGVGLRGGLDIYVGRLPARTEAEANTLVSKIIHYDTAPATLGDWRLRIGFAADDEDNGLHLRDMDDIARANEVNDPLFNQQKVYFDAFRQVSTAGEPRFPDANLLLTANIFKGQLTLTYLGHGGFNGWAQERVLTVPDIQRMENMDALTLMVTATCSFAAYDDPAITSPAEFAILNPKGGAIALFSTTRPVFTSSNKQLTAAVHDLMYRKREGRNPTFGQILTEGKNRHTGDFFIENSRKFTLIGDPSQAVALPKYNIVTTAVNGKPATFDTDTLAALTKVSFEGIIADEKGEVLESFNGTLFPTLFDKKVRVQTLGNDPGSPILSFEVFRNIIFKGAATVRNGRWTFSFWVPKDINYTIGKGRLSLYASDGSGADAGGVFTGFSVGGTGEGLLADDQGPDIDLYMNDENFVFGGITNANPVLLARLRDDFGINVTGTAVGHDITAVVNADNQNVLILNEFFEAAKDDYTSGIVRFPLKNLSKGRQSITVKAWDISNNSAEARTEFVVVGNENELLRNVYNYPNPFTTHTRFMFEHDLPNTEFDVTVNIYSISGKLVKSITEVRNSSGFRVNDIGWNGRDDYDSRLAKGVYLYKIRIQSKDSGLVRESGFEKLIVL